MKINAALLGVLLMPLGAITPLNAIGIEYGYHDTKVVARGNAGVASAIGPSSVYYNPALLGLQPQAGVSFSGYLLDYDIDFSGPAGDATLKGQPAAAASLFTSTPIGENAGLGFGLYSPFGQKNEFRESSVVRNLALDTELFFLAGTVALGFEVTPTFRLGVSASAVYSDASLNRGLVVPGDRFSLNGDGNGWGLGAGFSWDPTPQHRFAGSVRWWSPITYDGDLLIRTVVPVAGSAVSSAETELDFPLEVTVGYAWSPCPEWVVEIDVMYTKWSSFDQLDVVTAGGTLTEPFLWNDSFKIGVGATRSWDSGWWLGFGYWFAETTVPDETFNPRLPDVDLHVFSIGTGYETERWAVEVAYQFGYGNSRTIQSAPPIPPSGVSANGKMTYVAHGLSMGLTWFW